MSKNNYYAEMLPWTEQIRLSDDSTTTLTALLSDIMSRLTEFNNDSGTLSGGSATTVVDSTRVWATNLWLGGKVEVIHVADGKHYFADITGNNATTLTFATVGVTLAAGDTYQIKAAVDRIDLARINGSALTGADWTLIFQAIQTAGLNLGTYDTCNITYPTDVQEVYTFISGGVTTRTVTLNYSDATKNRLTSVVRA